MDLKPLSEVELREALGPINRAVTGHYLPSVRTVTQLRERAQVGVLDLKLSRCAYIGRELVGACLVERVDEWAHLDAIGVDPLAQQRGVGHALLEAACVAAEAMGVRKFTAEVSESDAAANATLHSAGFMKNREVSRWVLKGPPAQQPLPQEVPAGATLEPGPATPGQSLARQVELSETLNFLALHRQGRDPTFAGRPEVLERLKGRLTAMLLLHLESSDPVAGALVFERDRRQILALGGDPGHLAALIGLVLQRHGITHAESVPEGDPAVGALAAAGMTRVAVRAELIRHFP
jgi:GNAT superfamily N-acetyltransferase